MLSGGLHVITSEAATWNNIGYQDNLDIDMDNGVVYIKHSSIGAPCNYNRVEIRDSAPYSSSYADRIFSLILTARTQGKKIKVVYDEDTAPNCLLNSINVRW